MANHGVDRQSLTLYFVGHGFVHKILEGREGEQGEGLVGMGGRQGGLNFTGMKSSMALPPEHLG
ncbi:hypothetical protein AZSI13_29000 [Azospira sp. I13]|nr:hypothetical protein AZSI13_29000 [Azospira sp. I13]